MRYSISRSDKIEEFGHITSQIINSILSSNLIIADLTNLNANVFYELGISHTIDPPTILLWNKSSKLSLPFDIQDHRVISYDFENIEDVILRLKTQIKNIENGSIKWYNPIDRTFKSQIHSLIFNNTLNFLDRVITFLKKVEPIEKYAQLYSDPSDDYYIQNNDLDKTLEKEYNDKNNKEPNR